MNILITNDDGIDSSSLPLIFNALKKFANVIAVVPDRQRSGSSHSITLSRPLRLREIKKNIYTLDGTPTDCVSMVLLGGLKYKKIDLIISGINKGPNLSEDVFYSGTVAAAREGSLFGIPSIAISLASDFDKKNCDFFYSVKFLYSILKKNNFKDFPLLNINIPDLPENKIKGVKITHLGHRKYNDVLIKRKDPWGNPYFWLSGQGISYKKEKNSDYFEVKRGYISVTPLNLDLTYYEKLDFLKQNMVF